MFKIKEKHEVKTNKQNVEVAIIYILDFYTNIHFGAFYNVGHQTRRNFEIEKTIPR